MNQRSLKECKKIGCTNLTREKMGYCTEHITIGEEKKASSNRYYNKNVRDKNGTKYTKFYTSKGWTFIRGHVLSIYNGIDIYEYYMHNEVALANTVHHIIELKDDWDKRLNVNNLFPTSESNHNRIHKMYDKDKKGTQELLIKLLERYREEFGIPPSY